MIYSYVDTALRIIHFNQDFFDDQSDDANKFREMMKDLEASRNFKIKFLTQQVNAFQKKETSKGLFIHEFHHYWQSIFYPFLYYISWIEFTTYINFRAEFLESDNISMTLDEILNNKTYSENTSASVFPFYLDYQDGIFIILDEVTDKDAFYFTLMDLIEEATTVFQYKATVSEPNTSDFFFWIQNPRNKSYKKLQKYLRRYASMESIYNNFQACVQLAFHTTAPPEMFVILFNYALKQNLDSSTKEGYYSLKKVLDRVPNIDDNATLYTNYLRIKPVRITTSFLNKLSETGNFLQGHYPLSIHVAKYLKNSLMNKDQELILIHPTDENIKVLMIEFHPYAIHYNFTDLTGRNSTLHVSDEFLKIEVQGIFKDYSYLIMDFMAVVGTIQSIFTKIHESTPHLCHHTACTYHKFNYCRRFNTIPFDHADCYFPDWLGIYFGFGINIENGDIIKLNKKEVSNAQQRYDDRYARIKEKTIYQFAKLNNTISLQISKKAVSEMDPEYPRKLLEYVRGQAGLTIADSFNRFVFEFPEFENDPRPIFEILEIKNWIQLAKESIPELFFYIAFDSDLKQQIAFLPFFSKFTKISYDNGINIKFEYEDIIKCILNEARPLSVFLMKNGLDVTYYAQKIHNNINTIFKDESKI